MRSGLSAQEIAPHIPELLAELCRRIPAGVGRGRKDLHLGRKDLQRVLVDGAAWAVSQGFGSHRDLEFLEERGCLPGADAKAVSPRALERGAGQLGTLGSGNHFVEIQRVSKLLDVPTATAFGLAPDQVTVMIHSGSRGLGHQVCSDHLQSMLKAAARYGIQLPDRQLCCAPISSGEGRAYLGAMAAAANYAFANRQLMAHWVRQSFAHLFGSSTALEVVYDVCHNIAKFETFELAGRSVRACVHRKGATRAYPPHHPETPRPYREVGQPVLIPGDMGRYSYVLAGTEQGFAETFGSSCHGAGRRMSRHQAKKAAGGRRLLEEMQALGVAVRAAGMGTVAEEMPEAYKDVRDVVEVVAKAGISRQVAELKPLGVIKG